MKGPMRIVVKSEMEVASGKSIFPNAFGYYLPLGNSWRLTLDCGHVVYRQPLYKPLSEGRRSMRFRRRHAEDALPPPKRVHCGACAL